jgi:uncharacterized protein (DUF433 family)
MRQPVVISDPEIMHGEPCFRGTRVPVKNLTDYLTGGESIDEFLDEFPTVPRSLVLDYLNEADSHVTKNAYAFATNPNAFHF